MGKCDTSDLRTTGMRNMRTHTSDRHRNGVSGAGRGISMVRARREDENHLIIHLTDWCLYFFFPEPFRYRDGDVVMCGAFPGGRRSATLTHDAVPRPGPVVRRSRCGVDGCATCSLLYLLFLIPLDSPISRSTFTDPVRCAAAMAPTGTCWEPADDRLGVSVAGGDLPALRKPTGNNGQRVDQQYTTSAASSDNLQHSLLERPRPPDLLTSEALTTYVRSDRRISTVYPWRSLICTPSRRWRPIDIPFPAQRV